MVILLLARGYSYSANIRGTLFVLFLRNYFVFLNAWITMFSFNTSQWDTTFFFFKFIKYFLRILFRIDREIYYCIILELLDFILKEHFGWGIFGVFVLLENAIGPFVTNSRSPANELTQL